MRLFCFSEGKCTEDAYPSHVVCTVLRLLSLIARHSSRIVLSPRDAVCSVMLLLISVENMSFL